MKSLVSATILLSLAAYCGGINAGNQAGAGSADSLLQPLAEAVGLSEAAVEACGVNVDPAELAAAQQQQREMHLQMGGTEEQFEAFHQAGYDRARAEFEAASPAERERMCDEFKQFGSAGAGFGG